MLKDFGFGPDGTAKNFPQAKTGQLPLPDEDAGRPRVVPYVAMGAGFSISPIEMLQAYGAIANGGNLMMPMAADRPDAESQIVRRVLAPGASEKMRMILQQVVEKGTALPGRSKLYSVAGKTASSSYPRSMPFDPSESTFAGFIGFSPVKDPRLEIYVGIIEPESRDGAHGGAHAAPVFKELAEEILKLMKVAPDKP
jgi:cell division protein FtsI/penicillin-binding protein 2